jgi:hypothetical protein
LKLSTILLVLKFLAESSGLAVSSMGGMVSRGPPVGGMILAQPGKHRALMMVMERSVKKNRPLLNFMLIGTYELQT